MLIQYTYIRRTIVTPLDIETVLDIESVSLTSNKHGQPLKVVLQVCSQLTTFSAPIGPSIRHQEEEVRRDETAPWWTT